MIQATFTFPRGFLWGTATAAHQVEGNNRNNQWWAWELEMGRIAQGHKSGLACDWWGGRWREDFDRAAEGHQNAHRLSIEWSRIQPEPNRWDEDALDRYRDMLRGLTERGLTPMVTLHHFTNPFWMAEVGGWENPKSPALFAAFVRKAVEALKEYASLWCTINEPNVYATAAYQLGTFPPGEKSLHKFLLVTENLLRGHAMAYQIIHEIQAQARVGLALNYRSFQPYRHWSPLDIGVARFQAHHFNHLVPQVLHRGRALTAMGMLNIPQAKGTQDFLGINYYTRDQVTFAPLKPGELFARRFYRPEAALSDTGYLANEPEGLFEALRWANQFGVPVIVAENGIEDATDRLRPRYLVEHIHQLWQALNYNVPIKGYFHWTLVDNFEWERGWTQRFGLWELDVNTQARRKRPCADLYAEICRQNALTSEMVEKYAPEAFDAMFPQPGEI
ncbi:MAG: glycoside hydrolase family 1 protein [Chloroflexota bacterium]